MEVDLGPNEGCSAKGTKMVMIIMMMMMMMETAAATTTRN
jgi:hypothetical protein